VLTQEAFNLLLSRLDADPEQAARKYEHLRKALITYFERHGSLSPDEHTDSTFDVVARNLAEGKDIYIENPAGYFYGVARNLLRQYHGRKPKEFVPIDAVLSGAQGPQEMLELFSRERDGADHESRIACLEKCLATLPDQNRDLIVQYYQGEAGVKINNRKRLAERLGVTTNLLRLRAMRVRNQLEDCVEQCLDLDRPVM
jgi:RNA polymerase sigma factor (sigma-70 family)